jgi:hypothetical protein
MMADRVMRGSRLGAVSYETDRSHDLAPRQIARYRTENGEEFDMPFAADAEIPGTWLCRNGMEGTLIEGADLAEPNKVKVPCTPWDMLRERRSIEELEELLKERLESSSHAAAAASLATGRGHEPRPLPGPLTERSDLMTQKICFDCFHKLFPDKPIRKVKLGRHCVVCKAQTDRTEQMIPVEAEDIPLVKQIAQVSRRLLHRTERHADRRVAGAEDPWYAKFYLPGSQRERDRITFSRR